MYAYGGFHFNYNEEIYRCDTSLLFKPKPKTISDELLDVSINNEKVVLVTNVKTGVSNFVDFEKLFNIMDSSTNMNGILKIEKFEPNVTFDNLL